MIQPTVLGRRVPLNDWEGDDSTPGAGGDYVTCMDSACGRMVAFATNGRTTRDGKVYRAVIHPHDPNGINFSQAAQAVHTVAALPLIYSSDWTKARVLAWLRAGRGLVVTGVYEKIPRAYRHQWAGGFGHACFATNINGTGYMRWYDPLNPDTHAYGRIVPVSILWPFLESRGYTAGYVPLQPL